MRAVPKVLDADLGGDRNLGKIACNPNLDEVDGVFLLAIRVVFRDDIRCQHLQGAILMRS